MDLEVHLIRYQFRETNWCSSRICAIWNL